MNIETLNKLNDQELAQVEATAHDILQTRKEKRKADAMEQILQIAEANAFPVYFEKGKKAKPVKTMLRAGDRYINPSDPTQSYIVGKGKPQAWFVALREKGKLPAPVPSDPSKPKEV
jgi:hypothetical protein